MQATDTACTLSAATAPSGNLTFSVTNGGSKVTEFYLLAEDGLRIVGEIENIGPGISRDLVLRAGPGNYFTACKPGMIGEGIRAQFAVSDSGEDSGAEWQRRGAGGAGQPGLPVVREGPDRAARQPRPRSSSRSTRPARTTRPVPCTRRPGCTGSGSRPVAESFGDLDPKMDLREADLEKGQKWTGWHRIEKDLWPARAKGYEPLDAAGTRRVRRRPDEEHQHPVRQDPGADLQRRSDRQRLPRACWTRWRPAR